MTIYKIVNLNVKTFKVFHTSLYVVGRFVPVPYQSVMKWFVDVVRVEEDPVLKDNNQTPLPRPFSLKGSKGS